MTGALAGTGGHDLLSLFEGRWTLRIVLRLLEGPQRFAELRRFLPAISANILSARMRTLEEAGVIGRVDLPPPASCQVYSLTAQGETLRPMLSPLRALLPANGATGS